MYRHINKVIATGLFSGLIPGAPGTYGSILALFLIILFPDKLTSIFAVIIVCITGLLISGYEEKETGIKDDPRIVIDEIAGIIISFIGMDLNIILLITGFITFRFFDIVKPFPVNKMQELPGGWGIMADDILAGLITRIVLSILGGILYGVF